MSRVLLLAAAAGSVAGSACDLSLPWLAGSAVTHVITRTGGPAAITAVAVVVAVRILAGVLSSLALADYRTGQVAAARRRAAQAAVDNDCGLGAGDIVTRTLIDAAQVGSRGPIALGAVLAAATLVGALVLLATVHWLFLIALVATFLLVSLVLRRYLANTAPAIAAYRAAQARITDRMIDARAGAETIRAGARWQAETARVLAPLPQLRAAAADVWAAQRTMTWRLGSIELLTQIGTVVAGAYLLLHHAIHPGQLVAALGYAGIAIAALEGVEGIAALNLVKVGAGRLAELTTAPAARTPATGRGRAADVRLRALVLADGTRVPDADLPAGALVAVTGPATARTLLARTLAGRLAPQSGSILTDGPQPARTLGGPRPAQVGDHLAELVGLGTAGAADVRTACDIAQITAVVDGLPEGFATPLDELEISGGEWQRLGIAQALARGAGLVVLDDATGSLDRATEARVLDALRERATATVVLCTARAAVADRADLVIDLPPVDPGIDADRPVCAEPLAVAS